MKISHPHVPRQLREISRKCLCTSVTHAPHLRGPLKELVSLALRALEPATLFGGLDQLLELPDRALLDGLVRRVLGYHHVVPERLLLLLVQMVANGEAARSGFGRARPQCESGASTAHT